MAHLNDSKSSKMKAALLTGAIDDMEVDYAMTLAGGVPGTDPTKTPVEWWMAFFDLVPVAAGHFNDRAFAWLGGLGHTGSLSDRWKKYWEAP